MLDTDTKRRIDTARDILVGKVPDPKSQVEQITIALIYKFMDDMDAEAAELGGDRQFFTGDFAEYGWARLMSPSVSGHDLIDLYGKGISTMPQNPGIPVLFRDIFKNAYLPYRDPETLKSFLKIINEFSYDHSERLGDAFEYLLSVLGSQGDAGQFRTPRHIIDFMVEIMRPQKGEVILDPACGTAGFLISAYKYILRNNQDVNNISTLTPDEKGKLVKSFKGYDISPDMVRLSLVNLYLHGFANPSIAEYDTLTSEDRWNEFADLILANPPFMSPKGGIKPHKRFSIKAKRSEVLFVDYIAEHLTPTGRAGIIVPEGIIFQSQTAYKDLRKALLKDSLVAVISLPAGVFNPYSGVKTSIMILDKVLAKKSNTIAFFKVENDGFGLGAQRREIEQNDLPSVLESFRNYELGIKNGDDVLSEEFGASNPSVLVVPKDKIRANGDFSFSGERYRESEERLTSFPMITLGELINIYFGTRITKRENEGSLYPVYGGGGESFRTDHYTRENDLVISRFAMSAECVRFVKGKFYLLDSGFTFSIEDSFKNRAIKSYVDQVLLNIQDKIYNCARGHAQKNIDIDFFKSIQIPLPPIAIQQEIVAEIESYQKVIDGARAVIDNYRPHIPIDPDWKMVKLHDLCEAILTGPFGTSLHQSDYVLDKIPVINPQNIADGIIIPDNTKTISEITRDRLKEFTIYEHDILIARRGEMGRCGLVTNEMDGWLCGTGCFVIRLKKVCNVKFVYFQLISPRIKYRLEEQAVGVTLKNLNQTILSDLEIPVPPLETQKAIVAEIEAEQSLVNANRELITRFEKKIQTTLNRIWGEE